MFPCNWQITNFSFCIGKSTVSKIIAETCDALHQVLFPLYVKPPLSNNEWKVIFRDFEELWNLPHVIGAIDRKLVQIECLKNSGTLYHDYKGFFSLVPLAICDARYYFTLIGIGQYRSNNDSGVLRNSPIWECFSSNLLQVSAPATIPSCKYDTLPYFLLGDKIFLLQTWLMRPLENWVRSNRFLTTGSLELAK